MDKHSLKILLVIVDAPIRERLRALIQQLDVFTVIPVSSSQEAIEYLQTDPVNVIISDLFIGEVDGWKLSRMVRSGIFVTRKSTTIVLMTHTYCERIAETTARMFGIDGVMAHEHMDRLPQLLSDAMSSALPRINKQKILIVEDNPEHRDLCQRVLEKKFSLDMAEDGIEGLQKFRTGSYDVILLDVMLPGLSGMDLLTSILKEKPHQIVVVMTAHGNKDMARQMLLDGAADFISKPFRPEQLRHVCETAIQREDFLVSNNQFAAKVTALQNSEDSHRKLTLRHQHLLSHLSTVVFETDQNGRLTFLNNAWSELTGQTIEDSLGRYFMEFVGDEEEHSFEMVRSNLNSLLKGVSRSVTLEFKIEHAMDQLVWVEARFDSSSEDGRLLLTGTIDNINDRKLAEFKLQHLAMHDTLTGLYNRHYFDNELNRHCHTAARYDVEHSLLYIDLDNFKIINDSQGHQTGDMVLKEVANTLTKRLRESDIFCRIGGDEFAVILPNTDAAQAEFIANDVCQLLANAHFQFDENIYSVTASIGLTSIKADDGDAQEFLKQADIALYVAKNLGRNRVHTYSEDDRDSDEFKNTIKWAQKLREAIANDDIVLHFQPIVNIATEEVEYFEALVRLNIDGQLVFPGVFIPALERASDITLLDHQVISKAIYLLSKHDNLKRIAVNLSAQAFSDDRLLPLIEEKLAKYNVEPNKLIFELTESASLTNLSATTRMIKRLNELGCEFSIDDFGTGFSTFSYLKQLPAQSVKIDGSFVKDISSDPIDLALVRAINDTAKALRKKSVAEFVESRETLEHLAKLGVNYAQGFYISKPKDVDSLDFGGGRLWDSEGEG